MIQTTVMKGDSEVVHYDCPGVPLYIRTARLRTDGRSATGMTIWSGFISSREP